MMAGSLGAINVHELSHNIAPLDKPVSMMAHTVTRTVRRRSPGPVCHFSRLGETIEGLHYSELDWCANQAGVEPLDGLKPRCLSVEQAIALPRLEVTNNIKADLTMAA